ncbi:hypothetical protein [Candidatus Uabimicrobium amorphum]|uniref:hypothetical protein n=1 Tax=Uabimicrobium amorphum TaxID=2596890 RepID=UPI00125FACD0|nr:hypothetical protein [Candidatus Uabimicrobium amorphum]
MDNELEKYDLEIGEDEKIISLDLEDLNKEKLTVATFQKQFNNINAHLIQYFVRKGLDQVTSEEMASDVIEKVFIQLCKKNIDTGENYIRVAAKNRFIDFLRRPKPRRLEDIQPVVIDTRACDIEEEFKKLNSAWESYKEDCVKNDPTLKSIIDFIECQYEQCGRCSATIVFRKFILKPLFYLGQEYKYIVEECNIRDLQKVFKFKKISLSINSSFYLAFKKYWEINDKHFKKKYAISWLDKEYQLEIFERSITYKQFAKKIIPIKKIYENYYILRQHWQENQHG